MKKLGKFQPNIKPTSPVLEIGTPNVVFTGEYGLSLVFLLSKTSRLTTDSKAAIWVYFRLIMVFSPIARMSPNPNTLRWPLTRKYSSVFKYPLESRNFGSKNSELGVTP